MNALPSAVFFDRDGTIIDDTGYVSHPRDVQLIPGAADAISRINATLVPLIVVTNQSGIGRGYFNEDDYRRVTNRVVDLLGESGARVDAWYFCPHAPDQGCDCRKPGLKLFRDAAADYPDIDLARSLYVGDRRRDVEPGVLLGGSGVLVASPATPPEDIAWSEAHARVAPSLAAVVDWYLCTN